MVLLTGSTSIEVSCTHSLVIFVPSFHFTHSTTGGLTCMPPVAGSSSWFITVLLRLFIMHSTIPYSMGQFILHCNRLRGRSTVSCAWVKERCEISGEEELLDTLVHEDQATHHSIKLRFLWDTDFYSMLVPHRCGTTSTSSRTSILSTMRCIRVWLEF